MNYEEALRFIHGRPRMRKEPTLKRMTKFLAELGNPQETIKAVHVAGTNGKGSTIAFLERMIQDTGHTVGTFTSPFLTRFNERISVNGQPINDQEIVDLVEIIKPIVEKMDQAQHGGPLEFEIVTAMMFIYFKKHPVDIVLIEVGIGGKFDSTNVFTPIISVITNVGFDHMEILGDTLPKIAAQKAGIIKKRVPVITGAKSNDVLKVLKSRSKRESAALKIIGQDFKIDEENNFKNEQTIISNLSSGLLGVYQIDNLAVSIETMIMLSQILNWTINFEQLKKSIRLTSWAGRMEIVGQKPEIILDGAHNLPGIEALIQSVTRYWPNQKVYVLAAILEDKLFNQMLEKLVQPANVNVFLTNFSGPGKRQAVKKVELTSELKKSVQYEENWQDALQKIRQEAKEDDVIVVTGSLYFISEVRPNFKK